MGDELLHDSADRGRILHGIARLLSLTTLEYDKYIDASPKQRDAVWTQLMSELRSEYESFVC